MTGDSPTATIEGWQAAAACRDMDVEWFFSPDPAEIDAALEVCGICPVRDECLAMVMDYEGDVGTGYRYGVFGGLTPRQRTRLARR